MSKLNKNNLQFHLDEAKMTCVPGYMERWEIQKKISERVARFLRKFTDEHHVSKTCIYHTGMMNNRTLDRYLAVGEESCLSQEAIDHMAAIIMLLVPVVNIHEERKHLLKKKGGLQGVVPMTSQEELDAFRKDFKEAFGSTAQELVYNKNGIELAEKLNEYYHYMFSNLKK